jgi:hypothetical protein
MTKFIISRGKYVVHNIILEAEDEDAADAAAKEIPVDDERWRECGPLGHDVQYQSEGPYPFD